MNKMILRIIEIILLVSGGYFLVSNYWLGMLLILIGIAFEIKNILKEESHSELIRDLLNRNTLQTSKNAIDVDIMKREREEKK